MRNAFLSPLTLRLNSVNMGRAIEKAVLGKQIADYCKEHNISARELSMKTHLEPKLIEDIFRGDVSQIETAILKEISAMLR